MITVMGAGAFGTGLAISLSQMHDVTLWARDASHVAEMHVTRRNSRRLPGVDLPERITVTHDISWGATDAVLLSIPTQKLRAFCEQMGDALPRETPLIACCKGIEMGTGQRPSEILADAFPNAQIAFLTGPSFAADIARGLPTALTIAATHMGLAQHLQELLTTPNLRLYRSDDIAGAELGGALKNVMAIACGAVMGAGLGESARAALMTRGFAEMVRVAELLGGQAMTLNGLSGFGDLVLTCASDQSRNFRAGLALGRGEEIPKDTTIEGIATARAVRELADARGLDLPITAVVDAMGAGQLQVQDAMDMLLSRPLKEETC